MEVNIELLEEWRDDVKSALKKEIGCLESKHGLLSSYMGVLDAVDELISENDDLREDLERKQSEIDDLSEQLRQAEAENTSLRMQLLSETGDLRQQLVEAQEQSLEVKSKPMEIHNHFESGSTSQVFNDKVNGRFTRKPIVKKDKNDKKRWKKIVRKVL